MKLKRILHSVFFVLALACLLIPGLRLPANAANATSVTIEGITLSTGQYLTESGTIVSSRPASGGYAQFTSGGSLSLHNFKVGISGVRGISANGNLSIYLYGNNYIRTNTNHYAIYADGNIHIYGMDSGKLMAYSDKACAIYATGSVVLNSGDVEAVSYGSNVINAQSSVLIKGGTLEVIGTIGGYPAIWAKTSIQISGGDTTVTTPSTAINCSSGYVTISGGRLTAASATNNGIYANGTVTLSGGITYIDGGLHGIRAGHCKITGGYHKLVSTNTEKDSSYSAFSPIDGDKTKFIVDTGATAVGSNSATSANMLKVETANLFNYDRLECGNYVKVKGIPVPSGWYLKQGGTKAEKGTTPSANYASYNGETLTLDNFACSASNAVGIEAEKDIELFLRGTSSFSTDSTLAIDVDGKVIVEEYDSTGGSLSLTGSGHLVKITGELQLKEGTVTCVGGGNTVDLGSLNIDDGMLTITSTNLGLWVRGNVTLDNGTLAVTTSDNNGGFIEGSLKLNSGAANFYSSSSIGCYAKGGTTISDGNYSFVGYTDGLNTGSLSVTGGFLKARSTTTSSDSSYCALQVPAGSFSMSTALAAAADGSNTTMPQVLLNSATLTTYDSVAIGSFVYVNGVEVRSGEYLANGATKASIAQPSGGYAYLNGSVLSLNNYTCSTSGTPAVKAFRDLAIALQGINSLTSTVTTVHSYGTLEIRGNGSLSVTSTNYNALYSADKMTLLSNVTATTTNGHAIRSDNAIYVTSGKIRAESQNGRGVSGDGMVSCAGGELTAVAYIGIESGTSLNVNGGTVNVTGKQYGINSSGDVVVNKGSLTVNASNGMGIRSTGKMLLNGGTTTVTATGDGIHAAGLSVGNNASLLTKATNTGVALNLTGTGSDRYSVGNNIAATAAPYSDGRSGGPFRLEDVDTYHYVYIRPNTLKIAGIPMPSGSYLASWGTAAQTTQPSEGYAYYNNGVLTLNNFRHSSRTGKALEANGSLKIQMTGENSFVSMDDYAVYVDGLLEICGDGQLVMGGEDEVAVCVTHGLTVTSGKVYAICTNQQAIRVTMGDLAVAGGELVGRADVKSCANVNGTTYITGGFTSFTGYLNGLSTGKFSITGGDAYIGSTKLGDSWEALYITQSASEAFFMAGNVEGIASASSFLENDVMFDLRNCSSYNSVRFMSTSVWISGVELPDGMYLASGSSTPVSTEPAGGYAYYKNRDLTLYNYDDNDCLDYGINCNGDLDIDVIGANQLHGSIDVVSSLSLGGTGELNINAPSCGLQARDNIDLFGLTLNIKTGGEDSTAISTESTLSLSNAHVDVICSTVNGAAVGANYIVIYDGSLHVDTAGNGVFSTNTCSIMGCVVNIEADLCGMYCGTLDLQSGELTVVSMKNGMELNSFNMEDGTLSVQSCNSDDSYCAIALGAPEFTVNSELIMRGCETTSGTLREITRDEISSMDRIEISGHICTLKQMAEVPAACEAEGKEGYYYCDCGRSYQDGEGLLPIADIGTWGIIPATGHDFTENDHDEAGHWNYCSVCGDKDESSYGTHEFVDDSCYLCGYIRDVLTVKCLGSINYTVTGRGVTVDHEFACKLGYLGADGKYVTLKATRNDDGTYSFTAPAGVAEVILGVKGDITGDGRINVIDVSKLYAHVKQTSPLSGDILFLADITGDGRVNVIDVSKLYAHVKQTAPLTWDT